MKLYEKIIDGKQHCKPANTLLHAESHEDNNVLASWSSTLGLPAGDWSSLLETPGAWLSDLPISSGEGSVSALSTGFAVAPVRNL